MVIVDGHAILRYQQRIKNLPTPDVLNILTMIAQNNKRVWKGHKWQIRSKGRLICGYKKRGKDYVKTVMRG